MADDSHHDLWISKLARGGIEISGLEHLRHDTFLLTAHTLELPTRELLRIPGDKMSPELCVAWFTALSGWEKCRREAPHDPVPIHLEPLLSTAGRTILADVQGAASTVKSALQAKLAAGTEETAEPARLQLKSEVETAQTIVAMFPSIGLMRAGAEEERAFQSATAPQELPLSPSRPVELQPELPISPGGWESTLSGVRQMHGDLKRSLDDAASGEAHATKFLADLSDVRKRVGVPQSDVVAAIAELQLLVDAAGLHLNPEQPLEQPEGVPTEQSRSLEGLDDQIGRSLAGMDVSDLTIVADAGKQLEGTDVPATAADPG